MKVADFQKMRRDEELKRVAARKEKDAEKAKKDAEKKLKEEKALAALKKSKLMPPIEGEFQEVVKVCPRLVDDLTQQKPPNSWTPMNYTPIQTAFKRLLKRHMSWQLHVDTPRIKDWKPQGKSPLSLFRSLCVYLLSKYNTPVFLWSSFFAPEGPDAEKMIDVAAYLAAGGSFKKYMKTHPNFTVPLTSNMIAEFIRSPADYTFMKALRSAQVKCLGGSARLRDALMETPWGDRMGSKAEEEFWVSAVQWFGKQGLLDPAKVSPMCDYLSHCFVTEAHYSLKGRTALTVIRGMEAWHHELQRTRPDKNYKGVLVYTPSGYKDAEFDFSKPDEHKVEIWRINEILTAKELFAEGKRQNHCVGSYASSIESGRISIWTMTKEDETGNWAMLTLEMVNSTGNVVQARGRFNRSATIQELNILNRWYGMYRSTP